MRAEIKIDRISAFAGMFLLGYASCALLNHLESLKAQVPALKAQVRAEKTEKNEANLLLLQEGFLPP